MRRIILIDGENFLHGLRILASAPDSPVAREQFLDFPFKQLLDEVLGDSEKAQVLYFGAKLRKYEQTPELKLKTERIVSLQSRFSNSLQREGINFIKVGYLRARETELCSKCGHQEWTLIEKGVDVGLTVRMLAEASPETEIVLISSDTDLLPAVRASKQKGATITFIGYEDRPILSLIDLASKHRVITAPMVKKYLNHEFSHGN